MLPTRVARLVAQSGVTTRALSTSASRASDFTPTQEQKDKWYPKLGNRDIVGYGFNGSAVYVDKEEYPAPAVRFGENSDEVMALRVKERGDWKSLSLEDKKALYRASFCKTYAEMNAPTGEWKAILSGVLSGMALTLLFMIFMRTQVYPPMPHTITEEWMHKNLERMLTQRQGRIEGVSSKWDYEKNQWK